LTTGEREFLAVALSRIGEGEDASVAFGVKAKRGERRTLKEAAKSDNIRFAISWISKKITTEKNKHFTRLGISLDDAFALAATEFRLSEETLRNAWNNNRSWRSPSFDRPLWTLPDARSS